MRNATSVDKKAWYVLVMRENVELIRNYFSRADVVRERRGEPPVEYFLPTVAAYRDHAEGGVIRDKKLLERYVFIHDTFAHIAELRQLIPSMRPAVERDSLADTFSYMTVPDAEMLMFMRIAAAYGNQVPCMRPEAVDLESGDRVRIVGGRWDGIEGTLLTQQGKDGGRVVIRVSALWAVPTMEIEPEFIRILAFGRGNRHPYRKFEAHLPRAMAALGHRYSTGRLSADDLAAMNVFTQRFAALVPATVNLASAHAGLMLMSHTALGHDEEATRWLARCRDLLSRLKAELQLAQLMGMMYAATGDGELAATLRGIVDGWGELNIADRKKQAIRDLLERFEAHYAATKSA